MLEDPASAVVPAMAFQAVKMYPNEPGTALGRNPWAVVGSNGSGGVGRTAYNRDLSTLVAGQTYARVGVRLQNTTADGIHVSFRASAQVIYSKTPGLLGAYQGQVFNQGHDRVVKLSSFLPAAFLDGLRLTTRQYEAGTGIRSRLVYRQADDPTSPGPWVNFGSTFPAQVGNVLDVRDGAVDSTFNPVPPAAAPFWVQFGLETGGTAGESMNLHAILQGVRK